MTAHPNESDTNKIISDKTRNQVAMEIVDMIDKGQIRSAWNMAKVYIQFFPNDEYFKIVVRDYRPQEIVVSQIPTIEQMQRVQQFIQANSHKYTGKHVAIKDGACIAFHHDIKVVRQQVKENHSGDNNAFDGVTIVFIPIKTIWQNGVEYI